MAARRGLHGALQRLVEQAVLAEGSDQTAKLAQEFILPSGIRRLSFTIVDLDLVQSQHLPPDAFEAALIDTATGLPVRGPATGLGDTDALLNIQPDGRVFFAPGVQVPGVSVSGQKSPPPFEQVLVWQPSRHFQPKFCGAAISERRKLISSHSPWPTSP